MTDHEEQLRALAADVLASDADEATLTVDLPGGGQATLMVRRTAGPVDRMAKMRRDFDTFTADVERRMDEMCSRGR